MSEKGSEPRTLNRDAAKYRSNLDSIKQDTRKPSNKRDVPKSELPTGVRSRVIYGDSK
tara:strand:+ start:219 stop:392 length:174 start_codon:yes stop_codon:yes gene_type:complete